MPSCPVNIAPFTCTLSELVAFTHAPTVLETILAEDEPFGVRVTVEFSGGGAIALMPLSLPLRIDFFAKPYGSGAAIALGSAGTPTFPKQLTYQIGIDIPQGAASLGLVAEKIYNISALFRVGAPQAPSFMHGAITDLAVQIYVP